MSSLNPPSTAKSRDEFSFPSAISEAGGLAPSVMSSQMTDISENGRDEVNSTAPPPSRRPSATTLPWGGHRTTQSTSSRPGTGVSARGAWARSPPSRAAGQRRSMVGALGNNADLRPPSSASRTHAPSLTSHAFFRPMSSQRLQAQRSGQRPLSMVRVSPIDPEFRRENRQSVNSSTFTDARNKEEADPGRSPFRRVEMTDHGTGERKAETPNMGDGVRPLQRAQVAMRKINLNLDDHSRPNFNAPPPTSPHSFRSSFFRRDSARPAAVRGSSHGREKLSSVSSAHGTAQATTALESTPKAKPGRNYQYFTGNTVFCWGGRLQNTRHRPINIATGFLVLLPGLLFFIFSAPWIWHNISPAIPIIFAYVWYICLSSFIHGSLSDPGIFPRNLHAMPPTSEDDDPLTLAPPTTEWTLVKSFVSPTSAMELPTKFCKTCNVWRPPRCHHCRICDNCIETQDHHCVWLNNCVGRRNYRHFFAFVTSSSLLGLYLAGVSLAQILVYQRRQALPAAAAIDHFRVPFGLLLYGLLSAAYPVALTGYHLFLMGRGETTREYLNANKFRKADRHRAFDQGRVLRNILVVLCRPRPPTYLNFKRAYEEGDQRFGERRGKRTAPVADGFEMAGVPAQTEAPGSSQR